MSRVALVGASIVAVSSEVLRPFVGSVLFVLVLAGVVLFVLALVRWDSSGWKYALLVPALLIPIIGGVAGWVALFTGRTARRATSNGEVLSPASLPPPSI